MGVQYAVSSHPGFSNVVKNVPRVSVDEVVRRDGLSVNGERRIVPPDHKSDELMKDIMQNFPKNGHCCGTYLRGHFPKGKACLLVGDHKIFAG